MRFNFKVAIFFAIVGVGIVGYYYYRESQRKPEFNVFDLKVETYVAYVYVQNMGTADAHDVRIYLFGRPYNPYIPRNESAYENLNVNSSRLEILRVSEIQKVEIRIDRNWAGKEFWDYMVVVKSAEGVQNEFYFKK